MAQAATELDAARTAFVALRQRAVQTAQNAATLARRLDDIRTGLGALVADLQRLSIPSVAIPALGCGNGGLSWEEVEPLIRAAMERLPEVRALVYAPADASEHLAPTTRR